MPDPIRWQARQEPAAYQAHPVMVVRGSADAGALAARLPGVPVHVIETSADLRTDAASEAVAIVLRSGFSLGATELAQMPALRVVVRPGSGYDNIDTVALHRRGIVLRRAPEIGASAVAEWVVLAMLALSRRAALGGNGIRQGVYLKSTCMGVPIADHQVAVWGAGPIGRQVGRMLSPLVAGVTFAGWPSAPADLRQADPRWLCGNADTHVVALPLRDSTRGLFEADWLRSVRARRPHLVCIGRGSTIDLSTMVTGLRAGELSGLAIDPVEPPDVTVLSQAMAEPLNVFATPHIGAQRADVRTSYDDWAARELQRALAESPSSQGEA